MGAIAAEAGRGETIIAWQTHQGPRIAAPMGTTSSPATCAALRHAVPLPDPAALEREYRENYYAEEKPTFLAHAGEDQDWAILAQTDRLEAFERILRRRTAAACSISAPAPASS